jgi:hypothetical protein
MESQLKLGVEVRLLNKLLSSVDVKSLIQKELKITYEGEGIEMLTDVEGTDFMAESYLSKTEDGRFKIHKDGRVSYAPKVGGDGIIIFSYEQKDVKKTAWVIVDRSVKCPIQGDLTFEPTVENEDSILIVGDIKDWIEATQTSPGPIALVAAIDRSNLDMEPEIRDGQIQLRRKPQESPNLIFSEVAKERILEALEAYNILIDSRKGNTKNEEKDRDGKLLDALGKLKSSFELAIGGAIISKRINLSDDSRITKKKRKEIIPLLSEFKVDVLGEGSDWDQEIADYKKRVGGKHLDEKLRILTTEKIGWDDFKVKRREILVQCVKGIIENSTAKQPRPPLAEEFRKVKSITIQTAAGRVLFKATPKNSSTSTK